MFSDNYLAERKHRFIINAWNIKTIISEDIIENPDSDFFNLFKYKKDIKRGKHTAFFLPSGNPNLNEDGDYIYYILRGIRSNPSLGFNTKEELYLFLLLVDFWSTTIRPTNLFIRRNNQTNSVDTFDLIHSVFGNRSGLFISSNLLSEVYYYIQDKKASRSDIPIYTKIIPKEDFPNGEIF